MSEKSHTFLGSPSFTKIFALASFILFSSLFTSDQIFAEPITLLQNNGLGICTDTSNQTSVLTIAGNSGEAIMSWYDYRYPSQQIYLQKINMFGNTIWTNNGMGSAFPISLQDNMQLIKGTPGGCIVTWNDAGTLVKTISQNISSIGSLAWTPASGVLIHTGVNFIYRLTTASDGAGGVINTVSDGSGGQISPFIYHLDQSGSKLWGPIPIIIVSSDKRDFTSTVNSAGNTFIVFSDNRTEVGGTSTWTASYADIWAQTVDSSGNLKSSTLGRPICTAAGEQSEPKIISDSTGAIVVWKDFRNGSNFDIYARKIDNNGNELWINNGIPICTASGDQIQVNMCDDGAGGAYIVWSDSRTTPYRIYIQRITGAGSVYPGWTTDGMQVGPSTGNQHFPVVTCDGKNNAIVTWNDYRSGTASDIYAQKISGSGSLLWGSSGLAICNASLNQYNPSITTVKPGVVNIAWTDLRNGNSDIYCQMVTDSISPAYVSPTGNDHTGDGSLSAPLKTIQTALSWVSSSGEVRLLPGVYTQEASTYVSNSMVNWPNKTGIKLMLNPGSTTPATIDARSLGRIFNIPYSVNMTIEGINIINGKVSSNYGGAINIAINTNLTLNKVSIIYCTAETTGYAGGAVYVANTATGSKIFANNCLFYGNRSVAGSVAYQGTWEVVECKFINNYSGSGGVSAYTYWTTDRSQYINNSANNGGVSSYDYKFDASNSIYYGNSGNGGVLYLPYSIPSFKNCSIVGNTSVSYSIVYSSLETVYNNTIIWGNTGPSGCNNPGTTRLNNCVYQIGFNGFLPSTSSYYADPLLISTTYGDSGFLTPAPNSLCIDNALNSITLPTTFDAADNPRNHGFARDIGAYEFQGPSIKMTTPEAGKVYTGLTKITIGWTTSDESGVASNSINIKSSTDNGLTWQSIASGLANTGVYTWESVPAGNYNISIEAANAGGLYGITSILAPFSFSINTIYVSTTGSDDAGLGTLNSPFKTIQKGLNAVSTGETVKVLAGTYSGTKNIALNWPSANNITLKGEGPDKTIIDSFSADRILSISKSVNATIKDISFNNGKAADSTSALAGGQSGGAILSSASSLNINNCHFNNNRAGSSLNFSAGWQGGDGGAISMGSGALYIQNSSFDNNGTGLGINTSTSGHGGAIKTSGLTSIDASSFTGNYTSPSASSGYGGAVNIQSSISTYITNCNFNFNRTGNGSAAGTSGQGGALFASNPPIIANCTFIGNSTGATLSGASGNGGATYFSSGAAPAKIFSSQFITNETGDSSGNIGGLGGAICGTYLYASNCYFISNNTGYSGLTGGSAEGGAISATTITLESCAFENNFCGDGSSYGGSGGAIVGQTIFANKCTFEANLAGGGPTSNGGHGGAIYTGFGTVVATNCVFGMNKAGTAGSAGGKGGAIYTQNLISRNCIFYLNKAGNCTGGVAGAGGAINSTGTITTTNCAFVSNEAGGGFTPGSGGAIYANIASIVNCSLAYNKTGFATGPFSVNGGGIQVTNIPSSKIINSILTNNQRYSSGAYVEDLSAQTNITTITFSNVEGIGASGGNLNLDPKFLTYDINNPYFIFPGDPLAFKNRGTPAASASPALNGLTRPQFTLYDMGAIEVGTYALTIEPASVKINGQNVINVQYLPKLPSIEADITDPFAQFIPTSTEVTIGSVTYLATSTYTSGNTSHITLTPITPLPDGLNSLSIFAIGPYGDSVTYNSSQMNISSVLSVVGKMKNIPNPFRPRHGQSTTIVYILSTDTDTKLMIYDITGRAIWQKSYAAGTDGGKTNENRVIWDGKTDFNEFAGNGAYIYILTDGKKIIAKGQLAVID